MSDYLPFEIRMEIMKKLPVKSLIQSRTVSKSWKSLIDSSDFIAHYSCMQHILVSYEQAHDDKPNYLSFVDDHTFPQHFVFHTAPLLFNMLLNTSIIGSSHGLVCLHGVYRKTVGDSGSYTHMVVLWNLSVKRAIPVVVPNVMYGMYDVFFVSGVCRVTADPKIVKIMYVKNEKDIERVSCIPWHVEVFTLSTGVWRSLCSNLPRKSIKFWRFTARVDVDGVLYWLATDRIIVDGGFSSYKLIISFDITSEEFGEVNLPRSLACLTDGNLAMYKLREESLAVIHHAVEADNPVIDVWMMEDGVRKLFTKLYTINVNTPGAKINTLDNAFVEGFRKSGEPIIDILKNEFPALDLVVYDPNSKDAHYLGIDGIACRFFVYPYMETLLLLDQPNYAVYNEMETIRFLDDLVS